MVRLRCGDGSGIRRACLSRQAGASDNSICSLIVAIFARFTFDDGDVKGVVCLGLPNTLSAYEVTCDRRGRSLLRLRYERLTG